MAKQEDMDIAEKVATVIIALVVLGGLFWYMAFSMTSMFNNQLMDECLKSGRVSVVNGHIECKYEKTVTK